MHAGPVLGRVCYTADMAPETLRFGPLDISYDAQVLQPRPWTLAQSEWAAELLAAGTAPQEAAGPLLELCAGAGQIGLAAAALSRRPVVLVDASEAACRFARSNAVAAGMADVVDVRHGPMDQVLEPGELFALVLADPPYIPSAHTGRFPEDPLPAIDGGDDGLDLARLCLDVGARHLRAGGPLLLQLRDEEQADRLAREVEESATPLLSAVEVRSVPDGGTVLLLTRTQPAVDALLARARSGLDRVAPERLAEEMANGALVVDTRPAAQRLRDGELPGAVVVDRNVLEWRLDPTSPHRLPEAVDADVRVIVVCHEGYSSSLAAATLRELGLRRATDLAGGFAAWMQLKRTGTPAESGAVVSPGSEAGE